MSGLAISLLLAQEQAPSGGASGLLPLIYILAFLGVFIFTFVGFLLFSTGWESYEEKYLEGAERSVDDLFLTIPPQQMLWLSLLSAAFAFVLFWLASANMGAGFMMGLVGFLFPRVMLIIQRRNRSKRFLDQLVGALITVTNALRTGFSLPKAFQLIASDMPKPICQEFGIVVQELRLGIEVEEGLENLLERMPSQDLDLVVTSISISNQVGGNLAEVFDRIAVTIRERHRIEGRIDALTAQGKIQGVMVSALPFFVGFMLYTIDPVLMMPMFTTTIGKVVIAVMLTMNALGFFFIWKITSIEV